MKKGRPPKLGLTKPQITALLVTIRKELEVIFHQDSDLRQIKEGPVREKRIIEDLAYLIKEGYKADPDDANIYKIFDS
jgi:hypothetical protein